jgi:splicing factor 3B subunit 1
LRVQVIQQAVACDGVDAAYVRGDVLNPFFSNFWNRKMAMDRRNYRALVETTVALADKVGAAEVVGRVVDDLKDESEPYRRMVMETIDKAHAARCTALQCSACL